VTTLSSHRAHHTSCARLFLSNNSSLASRTVDSQPLPRPRPLHIEKKLSVVAKEDSVAYALFVEGMTLLAWEDTRAQCRRQLVGRGLCYGAESLAASCRRVPSATAADSAATPFTMLVFQWVQ